MSFVLRSGFAHYTAYDIDRFYSDIGSDGSGALAGAMAPTTRTTFWFDNAADPERLIDSDSDNTTYQFSDSAGFEVLLGSYDGPPCVRTDATDDPFYSACEQNRDGTYSVAPNQTCSVSAWSNVARRERNMQAGDEKVVEGAACLGFSIETCDGTDCTTTTTTDGATVPDDGSSDTTVLATSFCAEAASLALLPTAATSFVRTETLADGASAMAAMSIAGLAALYASVMM